MAFDKEELTTLNNLLDNLHTRIISNVRVMMRQELESIKQDIAKIKVRLNQLFKMESGDIEAAYHEIEVLKKEVKQLSHRIAVLEKS